MPLRYAKPPIIRKILKYKLGIAFILSKSKMLNKAKSTYDSTDTNSYFPVKNTLNRIPPPTIAHNADRKMTAS